MTYTDRHPSGPVLLYASARSPFARRVRLALERYGIPHQIQNIDVHHAPPEFAKLTPLGMIPVLRLPEGLILTNSTNILEWIHHQTQRVYPNGPLEWPTRQTIVFIHGLIQSAVAYHQEVNMRVAGSELWTRDFLAVIHDTLRQLSKIPFVDFIDRRQGLNQMGWDLAVALEYVEFRVPKVRAMEQLTIATAILEIARHHSSFVATRPK